MRSRRDDEDAIRLRFHSCPPVTVLFLLCWVSTLLFSSFSNHETPALSIELAQSDRGSAQWVESALPLTSEHLQTWWHSQSLVLSSLSYHILSSLLLLIAAPHGQHPLCSHYAARGCLFFDRDAAAFWMLSSASSAPLWLTDLLPGDCILCVDNTTCMDTTPPPSPSDTQRCAALCERQWSTSPRSSPMSTQSRLHCHVCLQSLESGSQRSQSSVRHAPFASTDEAVTVTERVEGALSSLFSLAIPSVFDSTSSFLPPGSRVPALFFRDVAVDHYQLFRLHDALVARPHHLALLYAAALMTNASESVSPPTPMSSSSVFSPALPYALSTPTISAFLSAFPLHLTQRVRGGGGGGSGMGYQIRCSAKGGGSHTIISLGGGGGGGYGMTGRGGDRAGEERRSSLDWGGGGGLGAGLQYTMDTALHTPHHTVGGGGGGGARLLRSGGRRAAVVSGSAERGGSVDGRVRLSSPTHLAVLNRSLASRMRHCVNTGQALWVTGGGGAGGGAKLSLTLPSPSSSTPVTIIALLQTAMHSTFHLPVDLCFLHRALPAPQQCAALRSFPSSADSTRSASPAPSMHLPSPSTAASRGRPQGRDELGGRISALVVGCLSDSEEELAMGGDGNALWEGVLCPCMKRGWTEEDDGDREGGLSAGEWASFFSWSC